MTTRATWSTARVSAPRRASCWRPSPGWSWFPTRTLPACCGAAGTYNLTQPKMSAAILGRKMDALQAADPDVVATGNPGCLMQIRSGVTQRGLRARVVHPVELLDEAYAN